jgi:hypothetical protein
MSLVRERVTFSHVEDKLNKNNQLEKREREGREITREGRIGRGRKINWREEGGRGRRGR